MPFRTKYLCGDCESDFYVTTENRPKGRCPSCPACKKNNYPTMKSISKSNREYTQEELDKNFNDINESRRAPGFLNPSNHSKAIDATAEIVMQDYQMTDINMDGRLRQGDNLVPKLSPELERKVDEVFKPQKPVMGMQQANNLNSTLTKQINAGAFKNYGGAGDVVARQQAGGYKIPTNIMYEHNGREKSV